MRKVFQVNEPQHHSPARSNSSDPPQALEGSQWPQVPHYTFEVRVGKRA